jgi:hypothetical protein
MHALFAHAAVSEYSRLSGPDQARCDVQRLIANALEVH